MGLINTGAVKGEGEEPGDFGSLRTDQHSFAVLCDRDGQEVTPDFLNEGTGEMIYSCPQGHRYKLKVI